MLNSGGGGCPIFGSDRRASPLDAALVNDTAARALDFDDVSNWLGTTSRRQSHRPMR